MDSRFEAWMLASGNDPAATKSRISNLRRIESSYGDLDALYAYIGVRLTYANLHNDEAALDECARLMEPVRAAWAEIGPRVTARAQ